MADIEKIQPIGDSTQYTLGARYLTHTPNNTTTFLRGDNTWNNTLTGGYKTSITTSTHINGLTGTNVALDMTAAAGYNMALRIKSNNGRFNLGAYQKGFTVVYGADSITTNTYSHAITLLNEDGQTHLKTLRIDNSNDCSGDTQTLDNSALLHVNGKVTHTGRLYQTDWVQFSDKSGLYFPNSGSGTHFYPANDVTYGSFQMQGAKNGYCGITMGAGNDRLTIMDNGGDKGLYQASQGIWPFYYNSRNQYVGIRTSSNLGYPVSINGSLICNNWIRVSGANGFYFESYGGGWHMSDSTWMRLYNGKSLYAGSGIIRTDRDAGGSWINGTHNASFEIKSAHSGSSGSYYQSWFSAYTQNGAWSYGCVCNENLSFAYGTRTNYNNGNNTAAIITFGSGGQVYGAVWNDYAEYRITDNDIEPGRCIREIGEDKLELTTERLQRGCEIVSDTFGFAIGESKQAKTPTAVSGRVLAYPYEDREIFKTHLGWPVCSGPNGTVSLMTEEEEEKYPSRIIGTVSSVPDYEEWEVGGGKDTTPPIKVNGRIWIRVR